MILKSRKFWDQAFKLAVLLGLPMMGWFYVQQHSNQDLRVGERIVPFRVERAPPFVSLKGPNGQNPSDHMDWSQSPIHVVNFWATWCPPCVDEMPALAELADRLRPRGVRFYFISIDEEWSKVSRFLEDNVIAIPDEFLFWDPLRATASSWKSEKFPETFVVNREGWMLEKIVGYQDWTRPVVVRYFEDLADQYGQQLETSTREFSREENTMVRTALALIMGVFPMAYADEKGAAPLIHEDDKKNLAKLQKNVETSNKNVTKLEAAIKDEERSFREVQIKVEREQKDLSEVNEQLGKVRESLAEVGRVLKKNEESLQLEKSEKTRVQKDAEDLQARLKELEKEINRTRDQVILNNQKMSTRLQNIESFEKALASSREELRSLKEREKKLVSNVKKEEAAISELQRDASKRESKILSLRRDLTKWNESLEKEKQRLVEFEKLLK